MELLELFLEFVLLLIDGSMAVFDVYAWLKGKENRHKRRAARMRGERPPPRDKWNRRSIALTLGVVVLTGVLVWRWVG